METERKNMWMKEMEKMEEGTLTVAGIQVQRKEEEMKGVE